MDTCIYIKGLKIQKVNQMSKNGNFFVQQLKDIIPILIFLDDRSFN